MYEALRDVLSLLQPTVGFSVKIELELEGDATISCVPEELNQLLMNLLENALQAVPADGSGAVMVRGHNVGGTLVLTIKDNGAGIDPADLPRIFNAFFTSKGKTGGTGLGLTIARRVVTALRGTIQVEEGVKKGPGQSSSFVSRASPRATRKSHALKLPKTR